MGREIRRCPLDWVHPQTTEPGQHGFQPLLDRSYAEDKAEYDAGLEAWTNGTHPDLEKAKGEYNCVSFDDWHGEAPDPAYYRPDWPKESMVGYQMYETVTEGSPVSPVFATADALEDWIVNNLGHSPEAAHAFVEEGWAPSFIMTNGGVYRGIDAHDVMGTARKPYDADATEESGQLTLPSGNAAD